jgi:hypothetical protein
MRQIALPESLAAVPAVLMFLVDHHSGSQNRIPLDDLAPYENSRQTVTITVPGDSNHKHWYHHRGQGALLCSPVV